MAVCRVIIIVSPRLRIANREQLSCAAGLSCFFACMLLRGGDVVATDSCHAGRLSRACSRKGDLCDRNQAVRLAKGYRCLSCFLSLNHWLRKRECIPPKAVLLYSRFGKFMCEIYKNRWFCKKLAIFCKLYPTVFIRKSLTLQTKTMPLVAKQCFSRHNTKTCWL